MKFILSLALPVIATLVTSIAFVAPALACQMGDKSKTLLVVRETPAGEENAAIADVDTATQAIELLQRSYYNAQRQNDVVTVDALDGVTYTFDLSTAKRVHGVCFPVVYAK